MTDYKLFFQALTTAQRIDFRTLDVLRKTDFSITATREVLGNSNAALEKVLAIAAANEVTLDVYNNDLNPQEQKDYDRRVENLLERTKRVYHTDNQSETIISDGKLVSFAIPATIQNNIRKEVSTEISGYINDMYKTMELPKQPFAEMLKLKWGVNAKYQAPESKLLNERLTLLQTSILVKYSEILNTPIESLTSVNKILQVELDNQLKSIITNTKDAVASSSPVVWNTDEFVRASIARRVNLRIKRKTGIDGYKALVYSYMNVLLNKKPLNRDTGLKILSKVVGDEFIAANITHDSGLHLVLPTQNFNFSAGTFNAFDDAQKTQIMNVSEYLVEEGLLTFVDKLIELAQDIRQKNNRRQTRAKVRTEKMLERFLHNVDVLQTLSNPAIHVVNLDSFKQHFPEFTDKYVEVYKNSVNTLNPVMRQGFAMSEEEYPKLVARAIKLGDKNLTAYYNKHKDRILHEMKAKVRVYDFNERDGAKFTNLMTAFYQEVPKTPKTKYNSSTGTLQVLTHQAVLTIIYGQGRVIKFVDGQGLEKVVLKGTSNTITKTKFKETLKQLNTQLKSKDLAPIAAYIEANL